MDTILPPCDKCNGELYKDPEVTMEKTSYPVYQYTICKNCNEKKWTQKVFIKSEEFNEFSPKRVITNENWIKNLT